MNFYIDLTAALLFLQGISGLFFIKNVMGSAIKKRYYIVFGFVSIIPLLSLYVNYYIVLICNLIVTFLIFRSCFEKQWFIAELLIIIYKLFTQIMILLCFKGIKLRYDFLIVTSPRGALTIICYPLLFLVTFMVTLFVDKTFRIGSFKEEIILVINNKKYKLIGYLDTGNIITYNGTPVIFIAKNKISLTDLSFDKEILLKTLTGEEKIKIGECLINIPHNQDYKFTYIACRNVDDFNGCDCLLNAYLH